MSVRSVFVTGATGLIGAALVKSLVDDGVAVVAQTRDPEKAAKKLGQTVRCLAFSVDPATLKNDLAGCDAVVNLAGASVAGQRWTAAHKRAMEDSRVGLTAALVTAMNELQTPPRVFVSGSAVGIYGDRGDEVLTERSTCGGDYLADLCVQWERAALAATSGCRVVVVRTGLVLGRGGMLGKMLPAFRMGGGGRIGDGHQYMSWIDVRDHIAILHQALGDTTLSGPVNATAPAPVTNREFTTALAAAVRRPAWFPVPAFALRIAFGDGAQPMTASQRAVPEKLVNTGFSHDHSDLAASLAAWV